MLNHVLLIHKNNLFSSEKSVEYTFNFWTLWAYFELHNLPVSPVHDSVNKPWILEFALTTFIFAQDTKYPSLDKKSYPANQQLLWLPSSQNCPFSY